METFITHQSLSRQVTLKTIININWIYIYCVSKIFTHQSSSNFLPYPIPTDWKIQDFPDGGVNPKGRAPTTFPKTTWKQEGRESQCDYCCDMGQNDTIGKIELNPSIVLSSDNTNYKNDIQLFHQLFDELSVYRDYN